MRLAALLLTAVVSTQAMAAVAMLVGQRLGTSVTGQGILICTYQYGNQRFERYFPTSAGPQCPQQVAVQ